MARREISRDSTQPLQRLLDVVSQLLDVVLRASTAATSQESAALWRRAGGPGSQFHDAYDAALTLDLLGKVDQKSYLEWLAELRQQFLTLATWPVVGPADPQALAEQLKKLCDARDCLRDRVLVQLQARRSPQVEKPVWNPETRELFFRNQLCKKFRLQAPNQTLILRAFQELHWPTRIDDPIPPSVSIVQRDRLADAVRRLNENPKILFELDGTGKGVIWKPKLP